MVERRPFNALGAADHGWLKAKHHFSFANYRDPNRISHGSLRVWNDDEIAPRSGFPPHPHANMEIITYVREGAITHEDSLGNTGRTEAGDVQVMSAGAGVRHAEYNREDGPTKIFQIWIEPREHGGPPSWVRSRFRSPIGPASSSRWRAALQKTPTPFPFALMRGCSGQASRLARRRRTISAPTGTLISSRREDASR